MTKPEFGVRWKPTFARNCLLVVVVMILFGAACSKRKTVEVRGSRPILARPATSSVQAAAEVTASSGPVRVTLRLLRNKIRLNEPLEVEVRLSNIGRERILLTDKAFVGPAQMLEDRGHLKEAPFGISVEVTDAAGKQVLRDLPMAPGGIAEISSEPATPEEAADLAEADKKIKEWRAAGFSDRQITLKLYQFSVERNQARAKDPDPLWLKPGESVVATAWRAPEDARGREPVPDGFTDLPYYAFPGPGRYRIVLRYLTAPEPWERKEFPHLMHFPQDVDVITPAISFEIPE